MQEKKQYKPKNKEEKKEKDQERPKTTEEGNQGGQRGGRGRGRGGYKDGGRGGKNENRPQTAKADNATNNREKQNETKQDGRTGGPKRNQNQQREQDKNSWIYKYHHIERLEYPKSVTKETEIPAMPTKEEKLKEPSKADFEKEMAAEDRKIQEKRDKLTDLRKKRRDIIDGGKMQGSNMTVRESLSQKISELKQVNQIKRKINDQLNSFKEQINQLETEKRMLQKDMHKNHHSVEEVQEAVRDLEHRLKVQTNTGPEERKIVKEIDQLQKSLPKAERFSQISPQIKELLTQKKEVYSKLTEVKKEVQGHEAEIEGIRKVMEKDKESQTGTREQANEVSKVIEKVEEELNEIYGEKDKKREEYWKGRYDFRVQANHIAMIDWMTRQMEKANEKEAVSKEREEFIQEKLKNLDHPYEKDITTCDDLLAFLHQLKIRAGLEQDSEQVAKETQNNFLSEQNREKVKQKLEEGKIEAQVSKAEREAQATVQIGGKKKKGKKQKNVTQYEDEFNIDFVVVQKFSRINVNPPVAPEDLDDRIKEIQKKKQWFEDNGEEKHQEAIAKLKQEFEQEEKELKEFEEQEEKERQSNTRGGYGRGGRGNTYGRGGGRGRGGRGRGGYESRAKDQFEEGSDSDDQYQARPSKPVKQKQKAEDLEMNDNNYPSLGGGL